MTVRPFSIAFVLLSSLQAFARWLPTLIGNALARNSCQRAR